MCMSSPKIPEAKKPDPIVKDEDAASGARAIASRDRSKIAELYGEKSLRVTGALGLPGAATTAAKTALGA